MITLYNRPYRCHIEFYAVENESVRDGLTVFSMACNVQKSQLSKLFLSNKSLLEDVLSTEQLVFC